MSRVLRVCSFPGCSSLTRKRRCAIHERQRDRVYGRQWRELVRPAVFAQHGYRCHYCGLPVTPADDVAHLAPSQELMARGLPVHDTARLVPAHRRCHNRHAPSGGEGATGGQARSPRSPSRNLYAS